MLTKTSYDRYIAIIANGITSPELCSAWDLKFLIDLHAKFDLYKRHTLISDAQDEQLDRIEKYLKEELGEQYE